VAEQPVAPRRSAHPALHTAICDLFGVRYPIVQTGMGWVSTPELTAATANAGVLGILASGTLTLAETDAAIGRTRELTSAPFGVNMRGDAPDLAERAKLLVKHGVRVASFALAPDARVIRSLKDDGLVVVPAIGARRHAEKVAAWGVDAVIAQGGEGGGHTGNVPTSILLPQVAAAVDIPVIGAGGFHDGRGLIAALSYGAAGVAMGTRFLLTVESPVPDAVKAEYLKRTVTDTVVTSVLDGVPQRVLRTPLVERLVSEGPLARLRRSVAHAVEFQKMSGTPWRSIISEGLAMKRSHELSWTQVVMAANTPMMLRASMVDGRTDLGTLASGQVAGVIDDLPGCAELVERIIAQATAVLERLAIGSGNGAGGNTAAHSAAGESAATESPSRGKTATESEATG
jgi:NAD(P)H-dependent flavin oxidoreductase YrpB (nitropropane dioxygenase family)